LAAGPVVCGEGYVFELERRGYLQAGAYVPTAVVEFPEAVQGLHREMVRAGSDIVLALTYYAHSAQLRLAGADYSSAELNRAALTLAAGVAAETGTLLAGDVCNTNVFADDAQARARVRAIFAEQVMLAAEAQAALIVGETFSFVGEALLALEAIRQVGLPAVITFAAHQDGRTRDDCDIVDACCRLADAGAAVVGFNCSRGPATMRPLLERLTKRCQTPIAALPVAYRTTPARPTFQTLTDLGCDCLPAEGVFPTARDPFTCNRYEIARFAREAVGAGVSYVGLCCGGAPHLLRSLSEAVGKTPAASAYSPDMRHHAYLGTSPLIDAGNAAHAQFM
jgi:betaine-homocysteine S-methyltransferase